MADFFGNLGKKISETADTVGKKTGKAVEIQKIKSQIRTLESSNEQDKTHLGEMMYSKFVGGHTIDDDAALICRAIQEREAEISNLRRGIDEIKYENLCPSCGAHVAEGAAFCTQCGAKIGGAAPTAGPIPTPASPSTPEAGTASGPIPTPSPIPTPVEPTAEKPEGNGSPQ